MNKILPKVLIDCSTESKLSFGLLCPECKQIRFRREKRFSKAGIVPQSEGKRRIYQVLYQREWEALREETTKEIRQSFNLCPICQRMVCDNCFLMCQELDMCKSCAQALEEEGKSVTES